MISKFAKAQKSWVAKLILTLTALSFMSLFGITGYLTSASNNRTVIKVDNITVSQAEFSYAFQKELNAAKNIMNIDFNDEVNDQLRSELMNAIAQRMLHDAIIDRTAQKHHVSFRPELIGQIIMNEPSFQDMSGRFNKDLFRRVLSENNITEAEYTRSVARGLAEQILLNWPVRNINIPQALLDAELKVDNKRRTFKYVIVKPDDISVDRKITHEEIEQYYEDFAPSFVAPETRDLSVVYISVADIKNAMNITDEEIKAYYDEHIDNYEEKEKRHVSQMIFEDQTAADAAYEKLQNGADFDEVALEDAKQSAEETDLGEVKEDELVFEIAEDVFALKQNEYTKPIQIGDIWQIMKVRSITPASKTDYTKAAAEIKEEIISDTLYDEIYKAFGKIEDELGAGKSLEEIATMFNTNVLKVKGLSDDGSVQSAPEVLTSLVKSSEIIDTAFSYAQNEISQTIETDEGLAVLRVDEITEMHQKSIEDVTPEIKTLWENNEKTAIAQETLNEIMHDLENDGELAKSAQRYGLHVYKSQPITRNETFADLSYADIKELFMQDLHTPYQTTVGNDYLIVIADQDYENSSTADEHERSLVELKTRQGLVHDLQKAMLDSYSKDYKIRIKYKLMGIED